MTFVNYFRLSFVGLIPIIAFTAILIIAADSKASDYDSETGTLTVPTVSVDGVLLYKDVKLKLDFLTNQFALLDLDVISDTLSTQEIIQELEPNDSSSSAQELRGIGSNRPLQASIGKAEDEDYFTFSAVAGRSYVIEIFDVANNLTLTDDDKCEKYRDYRGLFPIIYDPAGNEISRQCEPNGAGNTHVSIGFLAGTTGVHTIKVVPHGTSVLGTYSLRILPKYDEPDVAWDPITFEPNDWLNSAYSIGIGSSNALDSQIEARNPQFATNYGDADVYRIEAKAGETFIVEIFNVANNLTLQKDDKCRKYRDYEGLYPIIYDPAYNEIVRQCEPNGNGEIHAFTSFTAGIDGTYFIGVVPHSNSVAGSYSIRVIKQDADS